MAAILIVDDTPLILEGLRWGFKDVGYNVFCANDGKEAVEVLQEHSDLNLVITDYNMPRMDGVKLVKYINAHFPKISIILFSGIITKDLEQEMLGFGAHTIEKGGVDSWNKLRSAAAVLLGA